ncbi:hypothetical protein NCAS_0I03170 [Naumovozyma castellii]|uniref:Uncharacterized protein n=1 Tax=Naumovozyma castellii TaxID=27288 RepID=G0VKF1_NAUCA|nr:hypothetical protein NCAS_0I03170 [Naumovozyma castellii CBS 4309]CCC71985.1 hypothetical protein NCAS_0I03170 [Naumovozyma castellii CBS 4309]
MSSSTIHSYSASTFINSTISGFTDTLVSISTSRPASVLSSPTSGSLDTVSFESSTSFASTSSLQTSSRTFTSSIDETSSLVVNTSAEPSSSIISSTLFHPTSARYHNSTFSSTSAWRTTLSQTTPVVSVVSNSQSHTPQYPVSSINLSTFDRRRRLPPITPVETTSTSFVETTPSAVTTTLTSNSVNSNSEFSSTPSLHASVDITSTPSSASSISKAVSKQSTTSHPKSSASPSISKAVSKQSTTSHPRSSASPSISKAVSKQSTTSYPGSSASPSISKAVSRPSTTSNYLPPLVLTSSTNSGHPSSSVSSSCINCVTGDSPYLTSTRLTSTRLTSTESNSIDSAHRVYWNTTSFSPNSTIQTRYTNSSTTILSSVSNSTYPSSIKAHYTSQTDLTTSISDSKKSTHYTTSTESVSSSVINCTSSIYPGSSLKPISFVDTDSLVSATETTDILKSITLLKPTQSTSPRRKVSLAAMMFVRPSSTPSAVAVKPKSSISLTTTMKTTFTVLETSVESIRPVTTTLSKSSPSKNSRATTLTSNLPTFTTTSDKSITSTSQIKHYNGANVLSLDGKSLLSFSILLISFFV